VLVLRFVSQPFVALLSQSAKPALQVKPQVPPVHVVVALVRDGQTLPHEPQWFTFEFTDVSQPFAGIASQLPKPALHVKPQAPPVHVVVAFATVAHELLHDPQREGVEFKFVSQPFIALASQSPHPALHVKPHAPPEQVVIALARDGQTLPHEPQWFTSIERFTHVIPQSVCPPPQPLTQLPPEHIGVPPEQTRPHIPQ
jgi:hypothetical protein